ncbi:MAG: ATP-binding protein [Verrucomicrobia bacterium]|nr:ATP-binding protein [Verrucomicrobiota bacterium]
MTALYEADSVSQFLIYGNVEDRFLLPTAAPRIGSLQELLFEVLLSRFDVVLSYDLGNGIRIERGGAIFAKWPSAKTESELPKNPREAVEFLTHFFRYCANLARVGQAAIQIACLIRDIELIAPAGPLDHELAALITLIRNWSSEPLLVAHPLATFLIARNLNDAHPMLARNPRSAQLEVPVPSAGHLDSALAVLAPHYPAVLSRPDRSSVAAALSGSTLCSVERAIKLREHQKQPFSTDDLVELKKRNIESECRGLIEFVESGNTLNNVQGCEAVKQWLRQDIALWRSGDVAALPKGYLLCGPVGTGKSYLVECLAGEAGVPIVKLKNFRDRWVGSTEGNLEQIFRLVRALGRCYVFIDEADQSLGRRDTGNDSGVSGRIYSMLAEEMGSSRTRGSVIWILASSRPDLIEVDFKRPGRVDVKIPLLPAANREQAYTLIRSACQSRGLSLPPASGESIRDRLPRLLTPGAAENIAVKTFRFVKTASLSPEQALSRVLEGYQAPVPESVLQQQIDLAMAESSDPSFIAPEFQ